MVELCASVAAGRLGVDHAVGYVDVCAPTLKDVLARTSAPIVVPLFLASGYHVRQDVPAAVAAAAGVCVTPALGAAHEVVTALVDRVLEVSGETTPPDAVVLTAAGSSVESAREEVAHISAALARRLGSASGTAYLTGPGARPRDEVARLREGGHHRVVLAAHLLAPGYFLDRARAVAAELGTLASAELGSHPALVDLVVRRYQEAPV